MSSKKKNKVKKEKIVWYDDNSTIADMSSVPGSKLKTGKQPQQKKCSTFKEKWNTYWSAVRMMIIPMFVVLAVIAVLYVLIMLITGGFSR